MVTVEIVDIHPPGEAVFAFRDVSSAKEDRETQIHQAYEWRALEVPRARGSAAHVTMSAEAEAHRSVEVAGGTHEAFLSRVQPYRQHPEIVGRLLWLDTAEQVLAGREKYIVPGDSTTRGLTLWPDRKLPRWPGYEGD